MRAHSIRFFEVNFAIFDSKMVNCWVFNDPYNDENGRNYSMGLNPLNFALGSKYCMRKKSKFGPKIARLKQVG